MTVDFVLSKCEVCGTWHPLEHSLKLDLPHLGVLYFAVRRILQLPEATEDCDPDRGELEPVEESLHPAATSNPEQRKALGLEERQCVGAAAAVVEAAPQKGSCGRGWFIFPSRPPHVHLLMWRQLAATTRAAHIAWLWRIRGMPEDLLGIPLGTALVELTLRYARDRQWAWSTIASNLSCAASALRSLPLYTSAVKGIDMKADVQFAAALRRAQHLARVTVGQERLSAPLSLDDFGRVARSIKVPSTWLLAQLSWFFAARVGDMRQVCRQDVRLLRTGTRDKVHVTITFRFGKGAAFWGPYSIHTFIPKAIAQALSATVAAARHDASLFSTADQDRLAKAVRAIPCCSLRSFRRGSLLHLAQCGVSDDNLQLLSGHKRRDTLLRYLGWGSLSSTARDAAAARSQQEGPPSSSHDHRDGTTPDDGSDISAGSLDEYSMLDRTLPRRVLPAKMGLRSGFVGDQGRRVRAPPKLFPLSPPSTADLGLAQPPAEEVASWPLHVKRVGLIRWATVEQLARGTPLEHHLRLARGWIENDTNYGIDWAPLATSQVPLSRYSPDQIETLAAFNKIIPHTGPIRSFAKGWPAPQIHKQRLRPIFEPFINATLATDEMPPLSYPSRLERRAQVQAAEFQCEFDFAAYYDQIELAECVRSCFVIRVKDRVGLDVLYDLTRLPMGVRFAVGVAQMITWTITYPIRDLVSTCIDNVRISAATGNEFVSAVRTFLQRCNSVNATINDHDSWLCDDTAILQRGHRNIIGPFIFLGEDYNAHTVRNSAKNRDNLHAAYTMLSQPGALITRRRFAAIMGLIIFMAHTCDVGLWRFFSLLRAYSRLVSPSSAEYGDLLWDSPITLAPTVAADLSQAVGLLATNQPVPLCPLLPPGRTNGDYDVIIIVDASAAGWAAYAKTPAGVVELRSGWRTTTYFSAHAEPRAAKAALQWVRQQGPLGHVAVVTDHRALATGQRRWWSGYAGFSSAFPLNDFYAELYGEDDLAVFRRDVFFVEGEKNVADGPSRAVVVGDGLSARHPDIAFPDVSVFAHPYSSRPTRETWQV